MSTDSDDVFPILGKQLQEKCGFKVTKRPPRGRENYGEYSISGDSEKLSILESSLEHYGFYPERRVVNGAEMLCVSRSFFDQSNKPALWQPARDKFEEGIRAAKATKTKKEEPIVVKESEDKTIQDPKKAEDERELMFDKLDYLKEQIEKLHNTEGGFKVGEGLLWGGVNLKIGENSKKVPHRVFKLYQEVKGIHETGMSDVELSATIDRVKEILHDAIYNRRSGRYFQTDTFYKDMNKMVLSDENPKDDDNRILFTAEV